MKHILSMTLAVAMMAAFGGCLVTGQITVTEPVDIGGTTHDVLNAHPLDLNTNEDYKENKDKIKSVDGVAIVAVITNKSTTAAKAMFYISDDATLSDPDEVVAEADLVFVSPKIPAGETITIGWKDGFAHMVDEKPLIDQILGDGVFVVYAIAEDTPFDLYIKGEVAVTLTVGK